MLVAQKGSCFVGIEGDYFSAVNRVTAMADKLGVEFALIHRKRDGKAQNAPERMELLVGDVRDKERRLFILCRNIC